MRLEKPNRIDHGQWLSALGVEDVKKMEQDAYQQLCGQMEQAEASLLRAAAPRGIYRKVSVDAVPFSGTAIRKHLKNCSTMILLAVTLGAAVDRLLRTAQIRDMAQAVVLDCGASVLVEQICDRLEVWIRQEMNRQEKEPTFFLTGRYSPGYGDLPITVNQQILDLLRSQQQMGLTVNRHGILLPRKSITAIIGLSREPVKGYLATCAECAIRDACKLREKGKNCTHEVRME